MYEELRRILLDDLRCTEDEVRPQASCDEAGLDSLAMVELSMALSRRLGLEISDDELLRTLTVADIVRLMERQRAGA